MATLLRVGAGGGRACGRDLASDGVAMTDAELRETAANIRTNLLDLLRTFASPEEQRSYQAAVPFVPVPTELICGWADDLYHPDSRGHALAFSAAERTVLTAFDAEFRRWADKVPSGHVEAFIGSAAGLALVQAARVALASFVVAPAVEPALPRRIVRISED